MITDRAVANEISRRILQANFILDEAISLVQEKCPKEEAEKFKVAMAQVLAELLFEVANPLYQKHPDIAPKGLLVPRAIDED